MSLVVGIAAFAGGTWLLVESVEGLVAAVRGWALAAGLSGVVLAALVLGFDIESTAAGVAASLDGLPGTAFGTSIGAVIFLLTVGLGTAGLVAPFEVEVPRPALAAAGVALLAPVLPMLDGRLSRLDGGLLLLAFAPLFALLFRSRRSTAAAPTEATARQRRLPLRLAAGFAGLVVGAELLVFGAQRVIDRLDVSETLFGLLVVAVAVSLEEIVLEALPAYRGFPELAVGNALGTLVFLCTASLGVIALVRPLDVPAPVLDFHLPAMLTVGALVLVLLARGRVNRPLGVALLLAYGAYAGLAVAFGG